MSIITISRGTYSGGKALAEALSERLGYPCVSREVLLDAAAEYGVPIEKLTDAMEKPPSFWQQLGGERASYLNFIRAALCERAMAGDLIYHGHAGHLLLAGVSHVLRARVIADPEHRIKIVTERLRLGRKEAIAHIKKVDLARMKWTKFLYGVEWYDASLFDVLVNLGQISVEDACDLVARMTELPRFKPTAESQNAMENLALNSRVCAVLTRDPRTAAAQVRVAAEDGVVTITGTSRSEKVLKAIPVVAAQIRGVRKVYCRTAMGSVYVG